MELWDAYDREGRPLGVDLVRGEPVPEGMYHIVSEVIVRHMNGDYLLMLRDPAKPIHPGQYELTAGGSALKGETPEQCARRELYEETGLACDELTLLDVLIRDKSHMRFYVYFARTDCGLDSIRLQAGETVDYRWASEAELIELLDGGAMMPSTRERLQCYFDSDDCGEK